MTRWRERLDGVLEPVVELLLPETPATRLARLAASQQPEIIFGRTAGGISPASGAYHAQLHSLSGLVACYRLGELHAAGSFADDVNGQNLTFLATFDQYQVNGALSDGTKGVGNSARTGTAKKGSFGSIPSGGSARSILWFWRDAAGGAAGQYCFSMGSESTRQGLSVRMQDTGSSNGQIAVETFADDPVSSITGLFNNAFRFFVITYAGGGATQCIVYVNGSSHATLSYGGAWNTGTTNALRLSGYQTDTAHLEGQMDELSFFNRALSPSEIAVLWAAK